MSKKTNLKASIRNRTGSGRLNLMRKEGWLPSVMYGLGEANKNLKVNARSFNDLLAHSSSENILINLDIEGVGNTLAFLQDVQHHPITGLPIHADFRAIDENTEITAHVPLHLEGEPLGVKNGGGQLEHTVHSLEIRCMPNDLPDTLTADVTHLQIGDSLHIGELKLPAGVKATHSAEVVVAHLAKPRVVEEEPAAAAAPAPGKAGKVAPAAKAAPAAAKAAPAAKAPAKK